MLLGCIHNIVKVKKVDTIKDGNLKGEINIREESSKQLELLLSETVEQEIIDAEVKANWRTEIYGEEVIRKTLALEKLIRKKLIKANTAMLEWIELVEKIKDDKSYEQLGYSNFGDWIHNQSVSMSTVKSWLKIHDVYIIKYHFTCDELSIFDIKKLKIILPLAAIEGVTKEKVMEYLDSITSMHDSDLKSMVKEEIASFLSGSYVRFIS